MSSFEPKVWTLRTNRLMHTGLAGRQHLEWRYVQWRHGSSSSFKAWYWAEGSCQGSFSGTVGLHICCSFWQVVTYSPHLVCCYLWTGIWVGNTENHPQILCQSPFSLPPLWVEDDLRCDLGNLTHCGLCQDTYFVVAAFYSRYEDKLGDHLHQVGRRSFLYIDQAQVAKFQSRTEEVRNDKFFWQPSITFLPTAKKKYENVKTNKRCVFQFLQFLCYWKATTAALFQEPPSEMKYYATVSGFHPKCDKWFSLPISQWLRERGDGTKWYPGTAEQFQCCTEMLALVAESLGTPYEDDMAISPALWCHIFTCVRR